MALAKNVIAEWLKTTFTIPDKYAKREEYALFWVEDGDESNITKSSIELIGKRIEDLSLTYNSDEQSGKDVTGEAYYDVTGYDTESSITPLLITGKSRYSAHMNALHIAQATLDELDNLYLFVHHYMEDSDGKSMAYLQWGTANMDDVGAGLNGVQVNHTIHFKGQRIYGIFDKDTGKFTEEDPTASSGGGGGGTP